MKRLEFIDNQWKLIAGFFPDRFPRGRVGHPWNEHRPLDNAIFWHLHTGMPWRDRNGKVQEAADGRRLSLSLQARYVT